MDMMPVSVVTRSLSYPALARRVYRGEVLQLDGVDELVRAAREISQEAFSCADPRRAHTLYERDEFLQRAAAAQQQFAAPPCKQLFAGWLSAQGLDKPTLYWDTLGLRIAPPRQAYAGGFRSSIGVHRDTWGSAIQSQINWWAPVYPLSERRTMAFYPHYWRQPLANSTAQWSFEAYLQSRRQAKSKGHAAAYPSAPKAEGVPRHARAIVKPPCGSILAFAAAHLHASVPNTSSYTRFSFEIRTVDADDVAARRGAPNVDCASHPPLYRLFARITDGEKNLSPAA